MEVKIVFMCMKYSILLFVEVMFAHHGESMTKESGHWYKYESGSNTGYAGNRRGRSK